MEKWQYIKIKTTAMDLSLCYISCTREAGGGEFRLQ